MKKIFLYAAAMAVAMSSCSKNEVEVNTMTPDNAIGFGTYLGTNTKATAEIGFEVGDVMSVMAYATGADDFNASGATITSFMTNVNVTKQANDANDNPVWTYSPLKYWPKNTSDKISFFAVSDASTTARTFATLTDNKANFNYTNPATAATQVDLMAASLLNQTKPTTADATVNFTFKHILSQIKFTFAKDASCEAAVITVTKVTIDYADTFYADAVFTFDNAAESTGAWTVGTTTSQADDDLLIKVTTALTDAASDLGTVAAMIIPQDAVMNLTVEYTVKQDGSTFSETFTSGSLTPTAGFLQNTIYTYPVTISLDAIVFGEPTINAWPTPSTDSAVGIN